MKLRCDGCGNWHALSPTAMMMIINAYQNGELQRVTRNGILPLCMGDALHPDAVAKQRKDGRTVISIDNQRWTKEAA